MTTVAPPPARHQLPSLDALLAEASGLAPRIIEWRRHLHMHPEVAFEEHETARYIRARLAEVPGLTVSHPTATSTLAILRGARPGRTIAVRADIDALPILEENEVGYRSTIDGAMHACGHDGHTSIALGLVTLLARHRDALRGEVRFVFQHAEEVAPGGAEAIVASGMMDGVERIIGLHLWSMMPVGTIGLLAGPATAAPDSWECTITGKGGHAAAPHETIDPIAVAASVVTALQHIVSRNVDPLDSAVVSVTQFIAGTTHNVIPNSAFLAGTVRTLDPALRERVPALMTRIINGITDAHGATYTLEIGRGYRPIVNDDALVSRLSEVVRTVFGDEALVPMRPLMVGEDFSAYLQRAPGVFAFIGAGNVETGIAHPHHHPRFDIDERALDIGLRYLTAAALDLLA